MPGSHEPSDARRRFLKTLGLAGLSSALTPVARSFAQSSPPGPAIYPPGVPPPKGAGKSAAPAGGKPEPPGPDARALADIIKRRYGQHLSNEQIETIARDIDGDLKGAKRLHDVKLENGDEPDFTFHP